MSCRFHSGQAPVEARSLLIVFLLLINTGWFCKAQCPPDVISVFIIRDRIIHVPLTEPLCIACRYFTNQGNSFTFSDGLWRKGSTVLNDGDFNGNVNLSSTSNTMYMTLEYPDDLVNVGDTITCSSSTAGQQSIITFGDFVFLNPTVSPYGIVNLTEGSNLTLTCSDPGNSGMPRYVWINDSDGSELTGIVNNPPLNYNLSHTNITASGNYTCRSTYTDLPGINRETTVTINVQPLSLPSVDIHIHQNTGPVTINCTYETYDNSINVKWEHNDSSLDPNNDPYITVVSQSSYSELTISSLTQQYTGAYQCIVTNGAGSVKSGKVNVTIDQSVSSTTDSISNTLSTSSSSIIQPSNTIQRNSTITISPSNTQAVSAENDRTVVYVVSGLIVGAFLIIIVVVITATGCYFYRQYKATDKYNVNGEATSFTLEEFNDNPEKLKPYATLDELLSSYNSNDNLINGKGGSSRSSSIRIKPSDHHEEIDINASDTPNGYEKGPVLYSKINKPQKKPVTSSVNPLSPPPLPPVLLNDSGQPINLDPDSQPLVTSSDSTESEVPPDKILYADLSITPSSKPPGSVPPDPEKVIYSDISQLRRTASGHVVYADLNMLSSQVNSSKPTVALNSEKVVYVDIDAIKTQ